MTDPLLLEASPAKHLVEELVKLAEETKSPQKSREEQLPIEVKLLASLDKRESL